LFFNQQDVFLSDKNSFRNFLPFKKNLALRGDLKKLRNSFFMGDFGKLSGRPQLKSGKRTKKIDARFSEDEYALVVALEKELGISKTELVRMRLLGNAKQVVINSRDMVRKLDAIGAEMGRAGNNINQLAKHANTLRLKGALNPAVAASFNELLEDYIKIQQALEVSLRKIVRAMGC
jgi:hypothetical protein